MNFVKENKKPFKAIKMATKHKHLSQIYITSFKNVAHNIQ